MPDVSHAGVARKLRKLRLHSNQIFPDGGRCIETSRSNGIRKISIEFANVHDVCLYLVIRWGLIRNMLDLRLGRVFMRSSFHFSLPEIIDLTRSVYRDR